MVPSNATTRAVLLAGLCLLVALAGCSSTSQPGTVATNTSVGAASTASPTTAPVPTDAAGERAIDAEKDRVRDALQGRENVSSVDFGILRQSEYEVRERNASGVFLDVVVGYSMMFDCGLSADGMATETQYFVTAEETRLVSIEQNVTDLPGNACQ